MEKPSIPKGTRDFGPAQMAKRQFILENIKKVFRKYGFQPLETPAMENLSTLTGKYGDEGDQLLFKVLNSGDYLKDVDHSKLEARNSKLITSEISEKGLRYDLTVPFARYVVMNKSEITFPFKRFQMQPVWRADKPQRGRYREFYQCDADVVGTDSLICEAEIILMIKEVFKALGITDYIIKINHREILNGIAEYLGLSGKESELFVAIDKLEKVGKEKVKEELLSKGIAEEAILDLFEIFNPNRSSKEIREDLKLFSYSTDKISKGIKDVMTVLDFLGAYRDDFANMGWDTSLARGLSYYTGCIFEVKINNVSVGSVGGGGRYDNLTEIFGDKDKLSGVGFSFGVDRLYDAMEEIAIKEGKNLFPDQTLIGSRVLICHTNHQYMLRGLSVLSKLRDAGIASEIFPDQAKPKKPLEKPFQYALKKSIPYAIVIDSDDHLLTLKNVRIGEQQKLALDEIITKLAGQ